MSQSRWWFQILGRWSNLTSILFKWVEPTNKNQQGHFFGVNEGCLKGHPSQQVVSSPPFISHGWPFGRGTTLFKGLTYHGFWPFTKTRWSSKWGFILPTKLTWWASNKITRVFFKHQEKGGWIITFSKLSEPFCQSGWYWYCWWLQYWWFSSWGW